MWRLSFFRAVKAGINNFFRNGWLSVTAISVMAMTLLIVNFLVFSIALSNMILEEIRGKIGVNIYLKQGTSQEKIDEIMQDLDVMPGVIEVTYTSSETAMENFREKTKNNKIIQESLDELKDNPLEDYLSIRVNDPKKYDIIESEIITGVNKEHISKVDYSEHKTEIENLDKIIGAIKKGGAILVLVFIIISVLVILNSIRLTMYTYKTEIEIMKLVGANYWFIKAPFITEGALYGFFASILVALAWYPLVIILTPSFDSFGASINPIEVLNNNIVVALFLQIVLGLSLGVTSSYIAIRRYLRL
ncbi:MAG: FtsX-like permease family protein [Candidatus Moranbacteria bacterium]|nr:FtsX-like permease family protein [Candidatus Moranbacteria bacterium]